MKMAECKHKQHVIYLIVDSMRCFLHRFPAEPLPQLLNIQRHSKNKPYLLELWMWVTKQSVVCFECNKKDSSCKIIIINWVVVVGCMWQPPWSTSSRTYESPRPVLLSESRTFSATHRYINIDSHIIGCFHGLLYASRQPYWNTGPWILESKMTVRLQQMILLN